MFPIKNSEPNDWNSRKYDIVTLIEYIVKYWSATEET